MRRGGWSPAVAIAAAIALVIPFTAPAAAGKAHVHGKATLDIAIDGSRLTLEFDAPLEDLVGFERAPANDRERTALGQLDAYLESGRAFTPPAAAGCRQTGSTVTRTTSGSGHAEVRVQWSAECVNIGAVNAIDAPIFSQYPRLHRIDVRAVTPKGQSAARLTPKARSVKL